MNKLLIILALLLCPLGSEGQGIAFNSGDLLDKIANKALSGDKTALRDLGSLIDNPLYQSRAKALLMKITTFEEDGLVWGRVHNKVDFYNYYYPRQEKIYFDEMLSLYMVSPPEKIVLLPYREEEMFVSSSTLTEKAQSGYEQALQALKKPNADAFMDGLGIIDQLPDRNARQMLLKLSENTALLSAAKWAYEKTAYAMLLESLVNVGDSTCLNVTMDWLQKGYLTPMEVEIPLSKLTNRYIGKVEKQSMLQKVSQLKDSLLTFEEIRQSGFRQLYSVQANFFEEEVDYYGWLIVKATNDPWALHNAINMMIKTKHPRALYYLAALVSRNRGLYPMDQESGLIKIPHLAQIEKLTNVRLYISDSGKHLERQSNEWFWLLQYTAYWAQHWHEYEWDDERGIFINTLKAKTHEQQIDFHFRQLLSANDSLAAYSYRELTKFDPAAVKELVETFQTKLRGINPTLPSFKKNYLVQTSRFVQWCKVQKKEVALPKNLLVLTLQLSDDLLPFARHEIEQKIIQTATFNDLEGLEYEALLKGDHLPEAFSYSRILDKLYDKHLAQIMENNQSIRHYLKKSYLLEQIRTVGTCNAYLRKLPTKQESLKTKLSAIQQVESDKDVLQQLQLLANQTVAPIKQTPPTPKEKVLAKVSTLQEIWEGRQNETDRQRRAIAAFELLNTPSMLEFISKDKQALPEKDSLYQLLSKWYAGNTDISEYEEQGLVYILVLLHPSKATAAQRLDLLQSYRISDWSKANIRRKLLAPITYDELKTVLASIDRWGSEENGTLISTLVLSDFGLPAIDFQNAKEKEEFTKLASANDLSSLIEIYLLKMGIMMRNEQTKKLDFNKIDDFLQSEIIIPYTGGGGKYRDFMVYGIIKILEKNFNTTLGFHEKLNENQTFFTINASARARAWHEYLLENKLLQVERPFASWEFGG